MCSTFAFFRPINNPTSTNSSTGYKYIIFGTFNFLDEKFPRNLGFDNLFRKEIIFCITVKENTENSSVTAKKCDRIVVCDPNHNEEAIMDGKLVLGINPYKEICTLHLAGKMIIDKVIKNSSCT